MNQDGFVSVCIPVYNAEAYIQKTIECVLKQSYQKFELLVIDNASTDHTVALVNEFKDSRIRLIQNAENVGMANNWNLCLKNAMYDYIQILCADDQIYPTCLQEKVQVLEQNPEMVLVFSASDICNMNGDVLWKRRPFHQNRRFSGENFAKKSFRVKNFYGEPSNVMFRRKAAYKTGEFHVTMGYNLDWEYWLRLSVNGTVGYLDQVLSAFRVSEQSETTRMFQQRKKILEDDRALIASCQSNTKLTLSKVDLWSHWFTVRISLWMKAIFLAFSTRKVQKSKMV